MNLENHLVPLRKGLYHFPRKNNPGKISVAEPGKQRKSIPRAAEPQPKESASREKIQDNRSPELDGSAKTP
jgi:hypothetical protein